MALDKTVNELQVLEKPRGLPYARAWNIATRTAHIAVTGVLVGGNAFDVEPDRLLVWMYLSIVTGALLVFIEAYPSFRWFYQGRGVFVYCKLFLLCLIPWMWSYRVAILFAVIIIASVGSHMPGRFRYYSFVHRKVL